MNWWLPEGRAVGRLGESMGGTEEHRLVVAKQSWGVKYSTGNIVDNVTITM